MPGAGAGQGLVFFLITSPTNVSSFPIRVIDGQIISRTTDILFVQFVDTTAGTNTVFGSASPSYVVSVGAANGTSPVLSAGRSISFRNGLAVMATTTPSGTVANTITMSLVVE